MVNCQYVKEYPCKYVRFSVIIKTLCSHRFCFVIAGIFNGPGLVPHATTSDIE